MSGGVHPLVLFILLIVACGISTVYGLAKEKRAYILLGLIAAVVGAVGTALRWRISLEAATASFGAVFGLLGILTMVEGRRRRDRPLTTQGAAQILVGGVLLLYTYAPRILSHAPKGWLLAILLTANLPWVVLGILLLVFIARSASSNSRKNTRGE